jgi:hypothetical protein
VSKVRVSRARVGLGWLGLAALLGCIEPSDQRPGLYVSGEDGGPVSDWSFANDTPEIVVETRAWYLLPHSVTVHCAALDGKLYVGSIYREGGEFPDARPWNRNAAGNPNVRLKIAEKVYRASAVAVSDAAETEAALGALAAKYGEPWSGLAAQPAEQRPGVHFFRMEARS